MITGIIKLLTVGIQTGPFYIYSNVDGFSVPFLNNISQNDLLVGYPTDAIPSGTTVVRVQSINSVCNNYIDIPINPLPTTTTTSTSSTTTSTTTVPTTTTTTTAPPFTFELIYNDETGAVGPISLFTNSGTLIHVFNGSETINIPLTEYYTYSAGAPPYLCTVRNKLELFIDNAWTLMYDNVEDKDYGFTESIYPLNGTKIRLTIEFLLIQTTTTSTTLPPLPPFFTPIAYTGTNRIDSFSSVFSDARTTATGSQSGNTFTVLCTINVSNVYQISRAFFGFDCSFINGATNAGISLDFLSFINLAVPTQFVIVKTNNNFPANHVWSLADFSESNGATLVTSPITLNPGQTGVIYIPLNAAGLSYVNNNNDCTFVFLQYTNDYLNVAPVTVYSNNAVGAFTSSTKLYHN